MLLKVRCSLIILGSENDSFSHFVSDNLVDGRAFLRLRECDVKRMVQPIGLIKKICALIPNVSSQVVTQ